MHLLSGFIMHEMFYCSSKIKKKKSPYEISGAPQICKNWKHGRINSEIPNKICEDEISFTFLLHVCFLFSLSDPEVILSVSTGLMVQVTKVHKKRDYLKCRWWYEICIWSHCPPSLSGIKQLQLRFVFWHYFIQMTWFFSSHQLLKLVQSAHVFSVNWGRAEVFPSVFIVMVMTPTNISHSQGWF